MNNQQHAAEAAVAQQFCADPEAMAFAGMGSIARQPDFPAVRRRDLMAAVNTLTRDLGLRSTSVVVIDALLSCLPCRDDATGRDRPISREMLLTVYASNDTLCFRARGLTDRQLRRHLDRLEQIGLIARRDSANGKRFAIRKGGKVVGAFGIDLTPLLMRAPQLLSLAQERRDAQQELRGLKARIRRLCADCATETVSDAARRYLDTVPNLLRRVGLDLTQAREIIRTLCSLRSAPPCPDSPHEPAHDMSGSDGQNVRHKETKTTDTKTIGDDWSGYETVSSLFPAPPQSASQMICILIAFGQMIGLSAEAVHKAMNALGTIRTLGLLDDMAGRIGQIDSPAAYLRGIIDRIAGSDRPAIGKVGHGQPG